ncbi:DUF1700 domain-containing protein [Bacillus spongiae]|uniref:DUF1700 domain-containing protein n=1 Tax=Bacillus spongiae TaxID=2683610 RepID=A0ABU8HGR7_9BACI
MTKQEFLTKLKLLLERVPEEVRKEMLYDYVEHFDVGLENGKIENELIAELGDPEQIARDLLADYRIEVAENDKSVFNIMHAIIATTSLSLINIVFLLGPVIGLIGVYLSICTLAITLILSPLLLFFDPLQNLSVSFFLAMTLCSLGLIIGLGVVRAGKFLYNIILRYIKFNIYIIKGGKVT